MRSEGSPDDTDEIDRRAAAALYGEDSGAPLG